MTTDLREEVLGCDRLPSLPVVAARVLELVGDDDVSISELADTLKTDQALTLKILRTVNSSLYGLVHPCGSLNQAIVMLGLDAVKALALGFSLVTTLNGVGQGRFNHGSYWARAVTSGVAAKRLAGDVDADDPESCFLGALLQDIGVMACVQSLGTRYTELLHDTGGDHRRLVKQEQAAFGFDHAEIGAMLAEKWKLPESLTIPIRYHEQPSGAPYEHINAIRTVGLANTCADVLTSDDPTPSLRRLYARAETWFGLRPASCDEIITNVQQSSEELTELLEVDSADAADAHDILEVAQEQLLSLPLMPARSDRTMLLDDTCDGPMTATLPDRRDFDRVLIGAFEQLSVRMTTISVALMRPDDLDQASSPDEVIDELAARMSDIFDDPNALVARFDEQTIGVILTETDRVTAVRSLDEARRSTTTQTDDVGPAPSVSAGVVVVGTDVISHFETAGRVTEFAQRAIAAAESTGNGSVKVLAPMASAA